MLILLLFFFGCEITVNPILSYHSVLFHGNGATRGSVPVFSINALVGSTVTVPDNTGNLEREDHRFIGWNTNAEGTGTFLNPGEIFSMPAVNVVLYAAWERVYRIGQTGPAGGIVFYDKGDDSDGWRYLEAAPSGWSGTAEDPTYLFGYYRTDPYGSNLVVGTGTSLGTGETNTSDLRSEMGSDVYPESTGVNKTAVFAAKVCASYALNGYDDWFLPSKDELHQMYLQLKDQLIGGFEDNYYWSSSENDGTRAWAQDFGNGYQGDNYLREGVFSIRPIRSF
jgi:hypothetical protein